jgi:hypothetical protein
MGYTIETKLSADVESDVSTTENYFAIADVQRQTISAKVVFQNQPEVYFEIED